MSETTDIVLSVLEIVALVVVLAAFLLIIASQLRSVVKTLQEVTWGARAVERQLHAVRPNVAGLNAALREIAETLPAVTAEAERIARRRGGTGGVT